MASSRALKQFPAEPSHWLYGHLATHPGACHEGLLTNNEWTKKYPRYYTLFIGPMRPTLRLNHPETVKQILKTAEPKAMLGGGGYTLIKPWIGDGLLVSSGAKWFRNRKLLTPGFHFDVLKPYMGVYNSCVEILMSKFEQNSAQSKESMDIYGPISLCTLDIILSCAFSTKKNVQETGTNNPYVNAVMSLTKLMVKRAWNPVMYFDTLYYLTGNGRRFKNLCEYSHKIADDVIKKRRSSLNNSKGEQPQKGRYVDFLDILLLARDSDGEGLSDGDIRDEVETFMFEGHDTTASGLSWILYNLASHPDIQSKARDEVDNILKDRENEFIDWNDINCMPYLTMCIKESLRLHPPVFVISRETTTTLTIDDMDIPPHTLVEVSMWNVHHNPTVWEDPLVYDPERFRPDRMAKMDSHAFIPFAAGPRNCIGQTFAMNEMKTVIARILHRFEFSLDLSKEVRMLPDVVLRPENGINMFFKRRPPTKIATV